MVETSIGLAVDPGVSNRVASLNCRQLGSRLKNLGDIARLRESRPIIIDKTDDGRLKRKPLPEHLPREDIVLAIGGDICSCSGGRLHAIGESVSEMLDGVPAQLHVVRITRPKYACRSYNTVAQVTAPERLIAGGLATPALLVQVLVSKYRDHTPLFGSRRSLPGIASILDARRWSDGVGGGECWWLETLHRRQFTVRPT
jgi:transposase